MWRHQLRTAGHEPIPSWLVLGEVVKIYIDRRLLKDGVNDTANSGVVLRGGGLADYFSIDEEQKFRAPSSSWQMLSR